eukprot:UN13034
MNGILQDQKTTKNMNLIFGILKKLQKHGCTSLHDLKSYQNLTISDTM